jgi:hypothetical protein
MTDPLGGERLEPDRPDGNDRGVPGLADDRTGRDRGLWLWTNLPGAVILAIPWCPVRHAR